MPGDYRARAPNETGKKTNGNNYALGIDIERMRDIGMASIIGKDRGKDTNHRIIDIPRTSGERALIILH